MNWVADTSVVGPLVLPDEAKDFLPEVADQFAKGLIVVPGHWKLEVSSMLINAFRRKRIDVAERQDAFSALARFRVEIDSATNEKAWTAIVELAERHRLTIYDAAYLELSLRRGLPLATTDSDLRNAARAERNELFPS